MPDPAVWTFEQSLEARSALIASSSFAERQAAAPFLVGTRIHLAARSASLKEQAGPCWRDDVISLGSWGTGIGGQAVGTGEAAVTGTLSHWGAIGLAIGVAGLTFGAWDHQRKLWKSQDLEDELDRLGDWAVVLQDIEDLLAVELPADMVRAVEGGAAIESSAPADSEPA